MRFRSMWISLSLIGSRCQSTIMALAVGLAGDFHVENRVVAGLGKEDPRNLLGIHFDGHCFVPGAVQHGRNLACDAYAARGILVELALAGLGYDYFRHFFSRFLEIGHGGCSPLPLLRPATAVSSKLLSSVVELRRITPIRIFLADREVNRPMLS